MGRVCRRLRRCISALAVTAVFLGSQAGLTAAPSAETFPAALPMIASHGTQLVDSASRPVVLKGCNLGNLFVLESWMFGGSLQLDGQNFKDQTALTRALVTRFGQETCDRLMDEYRQSFITPRDFETIKSFGFNVVRLPFDYRLLQDDSAPDRLRPDGFKSIDHVLAMAEAAGVYVILDMHGVPGGQSNQDHTGEADQNRLWHNSPDQDRTVALWKAVAEHCKDRTVVAAYDLINEPYGDYREDVRPELASLMSRIAHAIRSVGDPHVLFFAGALNGGIGFYGDPHIGGQTGIGFTEHYYPGLFGSSPNLETHARLLGAELPTRQAYLQKVDAPYLVGEFNVVLTSEDPDRLMRKYYDCFSRFGWASTMWSYKLLKTDGGVSPSAWYLATNSESLPKLDVATCTSQELEQFFESLATAPLAVNESLRTALTTDRPEPLPLAHYTALPSAAPDTPQSDPLGYTSTDIGDATAGHTTAAAGDSVEVMGGGSDINASNDSFRFVSKPVQGSADMSATLVKIAETSEYAKAGVMARWGSDADSAMAMINAFPDGTLALISRPSAGAPTSETKIDAGTHLPIELKLAVADGKSTAWYRADRGAWKDAGAVDVPVDPDYRIGLAVCAHSDGALDTVQATLGAACDAVLPTADRLAERPAGPSLLVNGSFEQQGSASDQAASWNRWGDWINRETSWSPTHDGTCLIGYHHWQITGKGDSSGLWQDVKVDVGKRYTFTIFVQHDPAEPGRHDAETLELRLESVSTGDPVTLNSHNFTVSKLATGKDWSCLSVSGTATTGTLRVLAVMNPAADPDRGGAVKLDDATLTLATDGK